MHRILACALIASCALAMGGSARAVPLFAQRYRLQCGACHSVLPELNPFGVSFREHGYQLPLPKHGTTGVAFRYQLEWERASPLLRKPPFLFALPAERAFPPGTYLRGAAMDVSGALGYSDPAMIPYAPR